MGALFLVIDWPRPPCAVVWRRAQAPAAVAQGLTSSVPHRDDRSVRAETDTMWWLSFLGGGVVIMEAASLAQARLLAVVNGFGRASQFVEGYPIDAQLAARVPDHSVGRILTPGEARQLLKLIKYGPRK
jgi:hypothetical protein